jgi:hypothetical protein
LYVLCISLVCTSSPFSLTMILMFCLLMEFLCSYIFLL